MQQTKDSADSSKTLTAETVSAFSRSCKSIHHFYDVALSEYNLQKNVFWQTLLQVNKINRDSPVSKTIVQNVISYLHPAWTAGQVRSNSGIARQLHQLSTTFDGNYAVIRFAADK